MQTALDFRTRLLASKGCAFTCQVEADYGDRVYGFTLNCSYDGKDGALTVTAPETIAGIRATVDGSDACLEFDGISLEFGRLANGHVAPLMIPWLLGSAWTEDYISAAGQDGLRTRVTWLKGYNDEELGIDTWFEEKIPVYAEVSYDGKRAITIRIQDFSYLN